MRPGTGPRPTCKRWRVRLGSARGLVCPYRRGGEQRLHCTGGRICTEFAPEELLVPRGTVFQSELYVTSRLDAVTMEMSCTGSILHGICIGTHSEHC